MMPIQNDYSGVVSTSKNDDPPSSNEVGKEGDADVHNEDEMDNHNKDSLESSTNEVNDFELEFHNIPITYEVPLTPQKIVHKNHPLGNVI